MTQTKKQRRQREMDLLYEFVEDRLSGKSICVECGAMLENYDTHCVADLARRCEGFETIEAARAAFWKMRV